MFSLQTTLKCAVVCLALAAQALLAPTVQAALTVNADGTVTDTTTGLVWDRCVLGRSGPTCTGAANTYTWAQALAEASARNAANHLGYNNWRLPNKNELESIIKQDVYNPAIDTTAFPNTAAGYNWTSTTFARSPGDAFAVYFGAGGIDTSDKAYDYFVRLVRSGQSFDTFDRVGSASYTAPTPPASATSGNVTTALAGGGAGCALGLINYQSVSNVGVPPPAGVTFPAGLVNFTTTACAVGGTVTVTLTYPSALPAGTQFYKYGPPAAGQPSSWYVHPASIAGNTITYSVTDGGQGDSNPAPGVITDPGGPGVGGAGGAGVESIPTLSEWAMLLLASLMALLTLAHTKRQK
ncbi:MAG: hypothetical protein RIS44_2134 [Pseudomonadota bacterium]|jgi:hypothetical protein